MVFFIGSAHSKIFAKVQANAKMSPKPNFRQIRAKVKKQRQWTQKNPFKNGLGQRQQVVQRFFHRGILKVETSTFDFGTAYILAGK